MMVTTSSHVQAMAAVSRDAVVGDVSEDTTKRVVDRDEN